MLAPWHDSGSWVVGAAGLLSGMCGNRLDSGHQSVQTHCMGNGSTNTETKLLKPTLRTDSKQHCLVDCGRCSHALPGRWALRVAGEGASGEVFAARWRGREVAVKIFQAEKSPDGHSRDEMAIAVSCTLRMHRPASQRPAQFKLTVQEAQQRQLLPSASVQFLICETSCMPCPPAGSALQRAPHQDAGSSGRAAGACDGAGAGPSPGAEA